MDKILNSKSDDVLLTVDFDKVGGLARRNRGLILLSTLLFTALAVYSAFLRSTNTYVTTISVGAQKNGESATPLIETEKIITPDDWQAEHHLERGSNFGFAQNFMQLGPFRPRATDPDLAQLFWCGASIQPGTGVPTVMISAGFAVDAVLASLGRTLGKVA